MISKLHVSKSKSVRRQEYTAAEDISEVTSSKHKVSAALAHPQLTKKEVTFAFTDTAVIFRAFSHYDDTVTHQVTLDRF